MSAQLCQLGLILLRAVVDDQGNGHSGARVATDNVGLSRLCGLKERRYLSVFGMLAIMRRVYGTREGPTSMYHWMPSWAYRRELSYVPMDWLQ